MGNLIRNNRIFFGAIVFLMLSTILLTIIQVQTQQNLKQQAASEFTIKFDQLNYLIEIGEVRNISVLITNPDSRDISAVDFTLTYDSSKLTLNNFVPEGTFEPIINDNQPGVFRYVGANPNNDTRTTSTTVPVVTLHFLAKNVSSPPQSFFIGFEPTTQIAVSDQADSVLPTKQNASITIVAVGAAPTATPVPPVGPTATPIPNPSATPTLTPIPGGPTPTLTPTQAPAPGDTVIEFLGPVNKIFTDRDGVLISKKSQDLTVYLYKSTDDPANDLEGKSAFFSKTITLSYNNGLFSTSNTNLGKITEGLYKVLIKSPKYLRRFIVTANILPTGYTIRIPASITLADGVGDINQDNVLDISDYNAILSCYGVKIDTFSCTFKGNADLNDDNNIDGIDYNLFLKSLSFTSRQGD